MNMISNTTTTSASAQTARQQLSQHDSQLVEKAQSMTDEEISKLEEREFITPEELKLLVFRTIAEEYRNL